MLAKKMSGDTLEMRELAARICRDYLSGAWKSVTAQNIGFKHISGGLSNLLYHISLPESSSITKEANNNNNNNNNSDEPQEVLIRVYGQTHGERALEALITESVIFTLLSERGLGPKLHGIFPGGRIEQYIKARPLKLNELYDTKLSQQIAQKMAAIHNMEVPLHKDPCWLWDTMDRWLQNSEQLLRTGILPECAKKLRNTIDLRYEANWLKQRLELVQSPVVFCHNDMQEGNILIQDDCENNNNNNNEEQDDEEQQQGGGGGGGEPRIVVIDFEYCSYNYRAFDIANHFMEWIYDYTEKNHPFFTIHPDNYPTEQQRLEFIETYLKERGLLNQEDPMDVMKEVEVFTLASHLFWCLWGIVNAETSQIPFGYWEYAMSRLDYYLKLKTWITENKSENNRKDNVDIITK